jgi:hypothetical protein
MEAESCLPTDKLAAIRLVVRPERLPAVVRAPYAADVDRAAAAGACG